MKIFTKTMTGMKKIGKDSCKKLMSAMQNTWSSSKLYIIIPIVMTLSQKRWDGIMNTKIVMMRINRVMIVGKMMSAIYTK